ncbi:phytoene desaturase, partial [Halobacteriales archaeon QH_10_67_13]
ILRSAKALPKLRTMDSYVGQYFDHPKLRQLAEYKLVFLGGSPYNTPGIYTLMSHVDMNLGVYHPDGGIASVVDAFVEVGTDLGVDLKTGTEVTGIEPRNDEFRVRTDGPDRTFDRVVSNAPPPFVESELLPETYDRREQYWETRTYAPSAYLMYFGVEGEVDLEHHALVLPTDWKPHFDAIFEDPAWPEDPAYYVHVPSKTNPTVAPEGHEVVFALVPLAPGLDDGPERREQFRELVLDDLADNTGVDFRDRIVLEETASVSEFGERFNAPGGTALALAHPLDQTGPLRPGHRAPGLDGLYYVGAYTNPGIGMPMCILSGEHATEAIIEDAEGGIGPSVVPTSTLR